MNMTFMVGLGVNSVKNPMHIDSKLSGQAPPVGINVYGTWDLTWEHWANRWIYNTNFPWNLKSGDTVTGWPNNEGFFDVYGVPLAAEWTPSQTIGKSAYVYGVLSAVH